ncbi:MAG TPA: fatty acid desaturase [Oceanipulchritudo sp.]|nr:fatty acid desaturase [Oceanipulchritudo sp.]
MLEDLEHASAVLTKPPTYLDYSLTGDNARHHSDTIIVGRDPEIAVPRPPDIKALILGIFNLTVYPKYFRSIISHSLGKMSEDEKTFIPETEFGTIYRNARVYVLIYGTVIALSFYTGSILPLMYVGLANIFGSWLMILYGLTQHAGLAENVLDHRLNCRTVYMNPIHRFLYWNMNYHVEHHMFPLVPYHRPRELHEAIREDCPDPYNMGVNAETFLYDEDMPADAKVLVGWQDWRKQGLTEHRNWWPVLYREWCEARGREPDPGALAFSDTYEGKRADLKAIPASG